MTSKNNIVNVDVDCPDTLTAPNGTFHVDRKKKCLILDLKDKKGIVVDTLEINPDDNIIIRMGDFIEIVGQVKLKRNDIKNI